MSHIFFQHSSEPIQVQRIFCIGRNYSAHAVELQNAIPSEPVVFMKPPTSLVARHSSVIPFPPHGSDLQHEVEIVLYIGDDTKPIARESPSFPLKDAMPWPANVKGVTVGLDLTLRDVQSTLKSRGLPWEKAKAFEGSATVGTFVSSGALTPDDISFSASVNGQCRQQGHSKDMLFSIPKLIEHLQSIWQLMPGDLVFTGTPQGVASLSPGDEITIEAKHIGSYSWKVAAKI